MFPEKVFQQNLEKLRHETNQGESRDELITLMQEQGIEILDAIKTVRELFSIPLSEAKRIVASHPSYSEIAIASIPLHDAVIDTFENCCEQK